MAKITLDVEEENLSTVLNILKNLKAGLISNISAPDIKNYQNLQSDKRYFSKDKYKEKLKKIQRPKEDEFLAKQSSSSKYLSKEEFKNRLKKGK